MIRTYLVPKRARKKRVGEIRGPVIKSLPRGHFTIAGKSSRVFHITTHYPQIISNEGEMDAWDKKRASERRAKQKQAPKAKVRIRLHNKEYAQMIEAQEKQRKQNGYLFLKIKWKIMDFKRKGIPFTNEQTSTLRKMIQAWIEQTSAYLAKESFFLQKGENHPARRLAINRIGFLIKNYESIESILAICNNPKISLMHLVFNNEMRTGTEFLSDNNFRELKKELEKTKRIKINLGKGKEISFKQLMKQLSKSA